MKKLRFLPFSSALKISLPIRNVWVSQIITATVGAIIVLIVARLIS